MTLSEISPGQEVSVKRIHEGRDLTSRDALRLADLGLVPGHKVRLLKYAPLGDPLEIELLGYQLCLRKKQASCIEVAAAPEPEKEGS